MKISEVEQVRKVDDCDDAGIYEIMGADGIDENRLLIILPSGCQILLTRNGKGGHIIEDTDI